MDNHDFAADIAAVSRIDAVPKILEVVCRTTGMGFAAVARVTEDRWIACSVRDEISFGLQPGGELKVETTICNEIRASGEPVVIDHVAQDAVFRTHPTAEMYGFQSYISMPIVLADGKFFGTLCAIDPKPAQLKTPHIMNMFSLFAELIAHYLDSQEKVSFSEAELLSERETAELREQFIAVLGHDLRNPLASLEGGTELLLRTPLNERASKVVTLMRASLRRMLGLVNDVLDLAQGRLGGGINIQRNDSEPIAPVLQQVLDEANAIWPDRKIESDFSAAGTIYADHARIAQLFSNLIANAVTHGAAGGWIKTRAAIEGSDFVLSVSNAGAQISPAVRARLFEPFFRDPQSSSQGLGLGLYIASEIARAHGGSIDTESTPEQTRFTMRIPAHRPRA